MCLWNSVQITETSVSVILQNFLDDCIQHHEPHVIRKTDNIEKTEECDEDSKTLRQTCSLKGLH